MGIDSSRVLGERAVARYESSPLKSKSGKTPLTPGAKSISSKKSPVKPSRSKQPQQQEEPSDSEIEVVNSVTRSR
jgi:hypothetical protein